MSVLYWREPDAKRREPGTIFYVGLGLYAISFLLPSIALFGSDPVPGWMCAYLAFFGINVKEVSRLAVFGGLINPLALAYTVLRIRDRARGTRIALAGTILFFIPLTWLSLVAMHLGIRIGHIAWIAGILLITPWADLLYGSPIEHKDALLKRAAAIANGAGVVLLWTAVSAVLVLVGYAVNRVRNKPMTVPTDEDYFFLSAAIKFRTSDICAKINPDAEGSGGGLAPPGYQVSYLQSQCYLALASETGDLSLCNKVRTAHKNFADGSKYSAKECRQGGVRQTELSYWVKPEAFDAIIDRLGYRQEILAINYVRNPRLQIAVAWDPTFIGKLKAFPGFDESFSQDRLRQADDLEFLYYPIALDTHDPIFCSKISPNAFLRDQNVYLRSLCYSHLAYKDGKPELCNELPEDTSLSPKYSRASCKNNLSSSRITSAWSSFPEPWLLLTSGSLQHAAEEIGAELPPTKVPDEEYRRFFDQMVYHSNASAQAEFVQRVGALQ